MHGPFCLSSQGSRGSCTINIDSGHQALESASLRSASWVSNGLSRERTLAILGQFGGLGSTTTGKCATP